MSKITVLPNKDKLLRKIKIAIRVASDTDIEYPEGSKDLKYPKDVHKMYEHVTEGWYPIADPITPKIVLTSGGLTLKVFNTKKTLTNLLKRVEKMAATMVGKEELPARYTLRRSSNPNKQVVGELIKGVPEGIFTDGVMLAKGTPPGRIVWNEEREPLTNSESIVSSILNAHTEPAEISYYAIVDKDDIGVSSEPIIQLLNVDDKPSEKGHPCVVFRCGNRFAVYSQYRHNVIKREYPDAKYGMSTSGQLIAYQELPGGNDIYGDPVASIMRIKMDGEDYGTLTEPPGYDIAVELGLV